MPELGKTDPWHIVVPAPETHQDTNVYSRIGDRGKP